MSLIDTNTRVVRPTPETLRAFAEGRMPPWREPGRHRPVPERPTWVITPQRRAAALERKSSAVTRPDLVPVAVGRVPVIRRRRPGVLAMIRANLGRWGR